MCLEKRLSKYKITICSKPFGGAMAPLVPTGYAYALYRCVIPFPS